ncbi:MAG: TlyA family RNA methyltransferase [Paracoccaceae bacterium]
MGGLLRLDQALVARGLVETRSRAQALISAGVVLVNGQPAAKASTRVDGGAVLGLAADPMPWVSRAAAKLLHALETFDLDPAGATALDLGSSTGGFTEVLLARGAAKVFALDVGHGQLHPKLAADPRVVAMEGVNARDIDPAMFPPLDWITADLSFISLEKALPAALACAARPARIVALVKPQFEAGPEAVGKGGIVRDPAARQAACARISGFFARHGWHPYEPVESPVTGADGNREFLITATRRPA